MNGLATLAGVARSFDICFSPIGDLLSDSSNNLKISGKVGKKGQDGSFHYANPLPPRLATHGKLATYHSLVHPT